MLCKLNHAVKAVSDVCCTSSNAINVVNNMEGDKIIFVPDRNLGSYVSEKVKDKEVILWNGFCWVHNDVDKDRLDKLIEENKKTKRI
ncbi:Quinolinate synthetase A protein [Clostridium grantii DSM 8605]|uniref:quinolinate synthase n=1 Tax=Clostridium grantii DSM 8605 TaxID=1121316 RepID=A0A1M5X1L0_9CLOT|nr:Quinolinate synthetase A protein [Clostridium grantii DSM 8605]